MTDSASRGVVCRPIEERDLPGVVDCLARSFPERARDYWTRGLAAIGRLPRVDDHPPYGRLLEAGGKVVGVMLQIFSTREGAPTARCNLSSWCADAEVRGYAHALHARSVARRDVVYLNISAAPHTLGALKAVGYRCYSQGQFLFAPVLSRGAPGARVVAFAEDSPEAQGLSAAERRLLADHAAFGCLALIGVADGAATPFVFQPRAIWRDRIPCLHVIYCRDPGELAIFSGALGRHFARRGRFLFVLDANEAVAGLAGRFFPGREARYFKGAEAPKPWDLAYTELVLLGR